MSDEAKNQTYWKSLNQLAENEEYKKFAEREFPEDATELTNGFSRRTFLRMMGASVALAGFAACRRPVQKILPYSKQPEDVIPGIPNYYATAMPFQDALTGLIVENHEGRPTKLEGNEMHPASKGNTSKYNQAATLGMYDPDRSRMVRHNGDRSSYTAFISFCNQHFGDTGRNIAFISEANSSPTYNSLRDQALSQFPNATWVTYEPFGEENALEGTKQAFGQRLRTVNQYDKADVIVSLDDDFLNPAAHKDNVRNTRLFVKGRNVENADEGMSRLYSVESTFTVTGSNADNRLRIKSSEIGAFIQALGSQLSVSGLSAGGTNKFSDHKWVEELAKDLQNHRGSSVLTLGNEHKPELHAAVAAINDALGNVGSTVTYLKVPYMRDQNNRKTFADVVNKLKNGQIDTVVVIGGNPAFNAPADLKMDEALSNAQTLIHLSDYYDETSQHANWHINRAHFLEAWGDGYSYTGARSVIQPQIEPLYSGKSEIEFLDTIINGKKPNGYKLVQKTWNQYLGGSGFNNKWERVLHDGVASKNTFSQVSPAVQGGLGSKLQKAAAPAEENGIEVVIRPDSKLFDGRYANNGWLQELPDPMTKITWDNVALMSPKTAEKFDIEAAGLGKAEVEVITLNVDGTKVELPAWVQPGHADDSITITVGYGRKRAGKVGNGVGVNTYPLRTTDTLLYATNVNVSKAGRLYPISCTQDHGSMEGRSLLRHATLQEYQEHPNFSQYEEAYNAELPGEEWANEHNADAPMTIFDAIAGKDYPDYQPQWGMTIDLNSCIGCGTCTIACQAENNIPVIGKDEVSNGREMHWIRTDRYFVGDNTDDPKAMHQPVPCMHCELAPCEQVCPVAATTHSEDGMNQMTYNRCIGTRYCLNNCPYKVRRFNFFNYTKEFLTDGDDPEVIQMAMNPDVTVRFRGVMEKCSYCVQRVNDAKIKTQIETDGSMKPPDGMVKTACQQACPADAIYFGDLTDPDSKVSQTKRNNRNYLLLEELNTRPRTSYLAQITNPNPALA